MGDSPGSNGRISQHGFANSHDFHTGDVSFMSAGRDVNNVNVSIFPGHVEGKEDKLLERICSWLTKANFGTVYSDSLSKATEGTGMWFIESQEFVRWKRGELKILWGTGKPGAGKTVLSSIVIKQLKSDSPQAPVIFAFCRYTEKRSTSHIVASWIQQLLRHDRTTFQHVQEKFLVHDRDNTRPSNEELHQLMSNIVKNFNQVFIVLDGLDEAEEDARKALLDFVNSLPSNTHSLIMSRPLKLLQDRFPDIVSVDIEARNEDIEQFVEDRIDNIPSLHAVLLGNDAAKDKLCTAIKHKSGGMFLVASLQIEALKGCISVQSLMKKLETLPAGLDDMYDHTLRRIEALGEEKASLAKRVLLWVAYAVDTMYIKDIQVAVAIDLDSKTFEANCMSPPQLLLDVCCGLVDVNCIEMNAARLRRGVRLVHYTTSDFLKDRGSSWLVPHPHSTLSSFCVVFNSLEPKIEGALGLSAYARQCWGRHARLACEESGLPTEVKNFLLQSPAHRWRPRLSQHYWRFDADDAPTGTWFSGDRDEPLSSGHLASQAGLHDYLLAYVSDSTVTPQMCFTFLHMAAMSGYVDTAKAIMDKWPSLSANDRSAKGKTPVMHAAGLGHESMLEFLLSCRPGDEIHALNAKASCGCTALACAVGRNQKLTARLLLSRPGVDVNAINCQTGLTPLAWAVRVNDETIVGQILSNPSLNINIQNPWTGYTALMEARRSSIVKQLLSRRDIDVNLGPVCGCTPLIVSTFLCREDIICQLLSHPHINLHDRCSRTGTALSIATTGASGPNLHDHEFCSALITQRDMLEQTIVPVFDHLKVLELEGECDADSRVNPHSDYPEPQHKLVRDALSTKELDVLLEASRESQRLANVSIVKMLLEHDSAMECTHLSRAERDISGNQGSTGAETSRSLMGPCTIGRSSSRRFPCNVRCRWDMAHRELPIVHQLLSIDVNVLDSEGRIPLICAMEAECWWVVDLLLSRQDININLGEPPALVRACFQGQEALVRKLLKREDLDINAVDAKGRSALSMAVYHGHRQIAELLVSRPEVDVNVGSPTPLMRACFEGHTDIVELLLTRGGNDLDVNLQHECYPTALWLTCADGDYDPMHDGDESQLASRVDIPLRPPREHLQLQRLNIIRLLLQRADLNVNIGHIGKDTWLNPPTPLHMAALQLEDAVPLLLAHPDINVNALTVYGKTPLMLSLERYSSSRSAFHSLLSHPSTLDEPFGSWAFTSAVARSMETNFVHLETILSKSGRIDVNLPQQNGLTALSAAVSHYLHPTRIVAYLLCIPEIDPNRGKPLPLVHASIEETRHAVLDLLLHHPRIDINKETEEGYTALGGACACDNWDTPLENIKLLLSQPKLDVNAGSPCPLSIAVQNGNMVAAKLLLEHPRIDVNFRVESKRIKLKSRYFELQRPSLGLVDGCYLGDGRYIRYGFSGTDGCLDRIRDRISKPYAPCLVHDPLYQEKQCDVENPRLEGVGEPILVYCTRFGPSDMLGLLLPRDDLEVNAAGNCGCTALIWASSLGKWATLDTLLSREETIVNARCPTHGYNAIVGAGHRMKFQVVHNLLSHPRGHEMDPNVFAACGCNLLVCASRSGDEDTVNSILPFVNWREYPNAQDCKFGRTALLWASYFGHDLLVQLFLSEPRVSLGHWDKRGNTALMLAVIGGYHNVVQILLASGVANVHCDCDSNGDTALSLAEWYGHMDIVQSLELTPMEQAAAPAPLISDCAVPSAFGASPGPFAPWFWISISFVILSVLFFGFEYVKSSPL